MRIVFLDRRTIGPAVTLTHPHFEHDWREYAQTDSDQVVERLKDAHICITNKVALDANTLRQLPELRLICIAATGYDKVDIAACDELGITVCNVRGYATTTVPEHVFALMFALRRNLVGFRQDVLAGEWQEAGQFCFFNHPIKDLKGARLGVIGAGSLGRATAELGRAIGMDVVFAARKGAQTIPQDRVAFDELLATSDVISLHAPLTPETRGFINTAEFEQMTQAPILINTARGGLVDEAALVAALEAGQISGAGFDVLTSEPPQDDNPLLRVAHLPNVILTPHVAWASDEAMLGLWQQLVSHMENWVKGAPTNVLGHV